MRAPFCFEVLRRQLADARRNEKQNPGATGCDWEFEVARTPAAAQGICNPSLSAKRSRHSVAAPFLSPPLDNHGTVFRFVRNF